jgi:O-succinylbenzoic acid--CoA ligase
MAWRNQDLQLIRKLETFPQEKYFISLVPTQLQRLLNFGAGNWLSQFQTILLGGARSWESLLETARAYNLPIALTYGMTETASQVVTLQPNDFLAGNNSVGQVLPHAKVWISGEKKEILATGEVGKITLESSSLGLGYYPESEWKGGTLVTDDLGYFDKAGYLYVTGRNSRKIISGGENVFPDEIEAAILSTGLVSDVYVLALEDQNWGELVSAIYVPKAETVTIFEITETLKSYLSGYKIPKRWMAVASIPRNEQGKVSKAIFSSQPFLD